jgi:hypothetical protein
MNLVVIGLEKCSCSSLDFNLQNQSRKEKEKVGTDLETKLHHLRHIQVSNSFALAPQTCKLEPELKLCGNPIHSTV